MEILSQFESMGKSSAINNTASDFDNVSQTVKEIKCLIITEEYDADVAPNIHETIVFQGMVQILSTIEQPAHPSYKDKETLDFELTLDRNYYTNLKGLHVFFPIRFREKKMLLLV